MPVTVTCSKVKFHPVDSVSRDHFIETRSEMITKSEDRRRTNKDLKYSCKDHRFRVNLAPSLLPPTLTPVVRRLSVTRRDLAIAWFPLILLDFSIIEFLVGMVCWYSSKNLKWRGALMPTQLAGLIVVCIGLSLWMMGMWFTLKETKERTKAEKPITTVTQVAKK